MTPKNLAGPAILAACVLLVACASTPPSRASLDAVANAVRDADQMGARSYAPVELGRATQRLDAAEAAFGQRDFTAAERLAAQAMLEAQLAQARSRSATLREQVRVRTNENTRLRQELLGEGMLR